jgi:hypothetical protein
MDHLDVVTTALRDRVEYFVDWLSGCAHPKTTFPITLRTRVSLGKQSTSETYVVCLQCGRHLAYDWATMRIVRKRAGSGRLADRNDVPSGEQLDREAAALGVYREAEANGGSR